jgi:hypothetical protein
MGGTLAASNANEHAMRRRDQTYAQAYAGYLTYININNAQAAALAGAPAVSGLDQSLVSFGMAGHPIEDNISPTHRGFQGYGNPPIPYPSDPISNGLFAGWMQNLRVHMAGESEISPGDMSAATQALQENFRRVYGETSFRRATTRRDPFAFLHMVFLVRSWSNVLATVTVYPDGTMDANGPKLIEHPRKTK